jgi:hypothetical protein
VKSIEVKSILGEINAEFGVAGKLTPILVLHVTLPAK